MRCNDDICSGGNLVQILLHLKEANRDDEQAARFKHVSPVAWQHINFYGRYEFKKSPEPIDLDALVQELSDLEITIE
jgi:hypothetical protein